MPLLQICSMQTVQVYTHCLHTVYTVYTLSTHCLLVYTLSTHCHTLSTHYKLVHTPCLGDMVVVTMGDDGDSKNLLWYRIWDLCLLIKHRPGREGHGGYEGPKANRVKWCTPSPVVVYCMKHLCQLCMKLVLFSKFAKKKTRFSDNFFPPGRKIPA